MRNKKKGFTLVELIVVIAIIGVLAAIIVPTTLHFVNQGREEAANSDLTAVRNAVMPGLAEYNEYSPNNIKTILDAAGIANPEYEITITITATEIQFKSGYNDLTAPSIPIDDNVTVTQGTVTIPTSGEITATTSGQGGQGGQG